MKIRIGTRGSKLALTQAEWVKSELSDFDCEIIIIETKGDKILDRALYKIGDKGLFTAELEEELHKGNIDLAVHSLKDLPTKQNLALPIMAVTKREEPWDCVIFSEKFKNLQSITDLPKGSLIGTSSLRRIAQLKALREDFEFIALRGNVGTRLKKIHEGDRGIAAGILAVAGLNRLQERQVINQILDPEICLPAPGQGALAIQANKKRIAEIAHLKVAVEKLNHKESAILTGAERSALEAIEGGCQTPFAAYADFIDDNSLRLRSFLRAENHIVIRDQEIGKIENFQKIGQNLGSRLKARLLK